MKERAEAENRLALSAVAERWLEIAVMWEGARFEQENFPRDFRAGAEAAEVTR